MATKHVTINVHPTSYDYDNSTFSSTQSIANGYNNTSNSSNARFTLTTSYSVAYYKFPKIDVSPCATIDSIECKVKGYVSSVSNCTGQTALYSNGVLKSDIASFQSGEASILNLTLSNITIDDLENLSIQLSGRKGNNNTRYIYFYGAEVNLTYSYDEYVVNAISNVDNATISPQTQIACSSSSSFVKIYTDSLETITVDDNGTEVTNDLVYKSGGTLVGTIESFPIRYTSGGTFQASSTLSLPIGKGSDTTDTSSTTNNYASRSTTAYANYYFDTSGLPKDCTIDSVSVSVKAKRESSTIDESTYIARLQMYSGNNPKGSVREIPSTNASVETLDVGEWTYEETQDMNLRFTVGYYGGVVYGATLVINYRVHDDPHYQYTIQNIQENHNVIVSNSVIDDDDEDPTKTYYPLTLSTINAASTPRKGTTYVESGTTQTIYLEPSETLLTLALDNGVDVSNELVVSGGDEVQYSVDTAPNASYGFQLNQSTGFYTSTNQGVSSSAAVARLSLNLPVKCIVNFTFINYAEETYDFGLFGKVDTALSTTGWTAGNYGGDTTTDAGLEQLRLNTSTYNKASEQTLSYEIESGEHFIDIKYGKDQATDEHNDNLQFKFEIVPTEPIRKFYTYTIPNVNEPHSLIFIFGDVVYYFIDSSSETSKLYPNGRFVVLDNDSYKLTVVPKESGNTVSIIDNGVDTTQNLEKKEVTIIKEGVEHTVVNYIYRLLDVNTAHTLTISEISTSQLYLKRLGVWENVRKVFRKDDDKWVEIDANDIDGTKIYFLNT